MLSQREPSLRSGLPRILILERSCTVVAWLPLAVPLSQSRTAGAAGAKAGQARPGCLPVTMQAAGMPGNEGAATHAHILIDTCVYLCRY